LARADTGQRLFLTFGQALWGETPLALAEPDLGIPGTIPIRTDGLLDRVVVIPGIYAIDVYGEGLEFLRREFGDRDEVLALDYDWREDIFRAVVALHEQIEKLRQGGVERIAIVAHSMGGLITAYYLRYGNADFDAVVAGASRPSLGAVVLAGVPWGGSVIAFRNLQLGTSLGLSDRPQSAMSLGTFPSMYELMPAPAMAAFVGAQGQPLAGSIYDPRLWLRWRWGLLQFETDEATARKRASYTAHCLARAGSLHALLERPGAGPPARVPALIVRASGTQTLARAAWSAASWEQAGTWTFKGRRLREDGDGSVTLAASQTPPSFEAELDARNLDFAVAHEAMLRDHEVQEEITRFLRGQGF
jgi:pimeloyl-ACP methyl ester carboxylesterase